MGAGPAYASFTEKDTTKVVGIQAASAYVMVTGKAAYSIPSYSTVGCQGVVVGTCGHDRRALGLD